MLKWTVPFVVLALVIAGVFLTGLLETDEPGRSSRAPRTDDPPVDEVGSFPDLGSAPSEGGDTAATPNGSSDPRSPSDPPLPPGSGSLGGRVIDETGTPIREAVIHLRAAERGANGGWRRVETPELTSEEGRTTTDEEGGFRYEDLDAEARYALFVRAPGWIGARRDELAADGSPLEVTLGSGEVVSGIVLDPRGRRVDGATVFVGPALSELGEGFFMPTSWNERGDVLLPETTSAGDGSFVLTGIPPGRFSVQTRHDHWSPSPPLNLMQGQEGITLEMRGHTAVEGRVVDEAGSPLAGARLQTLRQGFGWGYSSSRRRGGVETDADGAFRLTGVEPGTLRLSVRAEGYPRQVETVGEIAEGEVLTGVEIVMRSGGVVTGTVVDPEGTPLAKANVWVRRDTDGGRIGSSVGSDEDGIFTIRGLAPDPGAENPYVRVAVEHARYAEVESEPFILPESGTVDVGTLAVVAATTISGRVTDLGGRPIADAEVELLRAQEGDGNPVVLEILGAGMNQPIRTYRDPGLGSTRTDEEGLYRIKVKEPGNLRVAARGKEFQRVESEVLTVADQSLAGIDLVLPPALRIEGWVVDEQGLPCERVDVYATADRTSESAPTDAEGRFSIPGLSEGPHQLGLAGEGWSLTDENPTVEAGTLDVTLVARRPGAIAGRIVDAGSGRPIDRFTIRTNPEVSGGGFRINGFDFGGTEYHDPEGRFLLDGLSPGRHTVRVSADAHVDARESVEIASGATTEVTIALELAGTLVGRVVDASGEPVVGALISHDSLAEAPEAPSSPEIMQGFAISVVTDGSGAITFTAGGSREQRTDREGRFRIEGIADGEYSVKIEHDAFREWSDEPILVRRGEETDLGTITLHRGARLVGTVLRLDGAKLMWANVTVTPEGGGETRSSAIDEEGSYTIGGLDARAYAVRVDYMLEPQGENDFSAVETRQHEAGTVSLDAEEERTLTIELPAP